MAAADLRAAYACAVTLARMGFYVFPVQARGKLPAIPKCPIAKEQNLRGDALAAHAVTCGRDGHGFHDATRDEQRITDWQRKYPNANIGIATGASGIVVLDVDVGHGGDESLRDLVRVHGELPHTVTVQTGSGGEHYYFRAPHGISIRNSAGKIAPGLDIRGDGGYVVGPLSVHPSGTPYEWIVAPGEAEIAELPAWLLEMITSPPQKDRDQLDVHGGGVIREGQRNNRLYSEASYLRRHNWSTDEITRALLVINETRCEVPLPESEVRGIAESVGRYTPESDVQRELDRLRTRLEARRLLSAELRGEVPQPEIVTLAELMSRPQSPVVERIEGLQPKDSRVVLVASRKSGKTTLTDNLVASLADGRKFLGCIDVLPVTGKVAILDFELSPQMAVRWMADQGIQNTDRVVLISMRGHEGTFDIRDPEVRQGWASRLRDAGVEYLILDCLTPVLDALNIDKNNAMGTFLTPFDALLTEAGITDAMVVHHSGWSQERARGDSTLEGWADAIWRLTRADETDTAPRFLSAFGRDVDFPETALHFSAGTRRLTLGEGSRRDAAAVNALAAIEEVLKAAGEPMSTRAIELALADSEHPRNAIRSALKAAKETMRLTPQPGPRNATLWQFASSPQFAASAPARSSEFASAPIERRTELTQVDGAVRGEQTHTEVRL